MKINSSRTAQTTVTGILLVTCIFVLGLSMPSCPGQQALQQQVDNLQTKVGDQAARIQNLDAKSEVLIKDMTDVKTLLTQVSNAVLDQRKEIDELKETIKKLQTPPPAPASSKKPGKKR